ncbi:MAG: MFS transporter [Planctomycetaceae bacterium]|nr:MFS transporter [Planctomycetaceae bacterium]
MPQPPVAAGFATRVWRAVFLNELLWTAGYALTSSGFLLYFAREFQASSTVIALLLVLPETAGISSVFSRPAAAWLGSRRRLWLWCVLSSRLVLCGIPLAAWLPGSTAGISPLLLIAVCLGLASLVNAIGYIAFVSWISDLVPDDHWGRFFALRNIVRLLVLLTVPIAGGFLRDWWKRQELAGVLPAETVLLLYAAVFIAGIALMLLSVLPMWRIPETAASVPHEEPAEVTVWSRSQMAAAFRERSMRFLLLHAWWLSAANGLTQAAFFGWLFGSLKVGLGLFYILQAVRQVVSIPVSRFAGYWSDNHGDRNLLAISLLVASCAMPCWLLSGADSPHWVFPAYALWGAFAAANIAGRNLLLRLAPRSDNTIPLTLFRQVSGLIAGLSGFAGGMWLDHLRTTEFSWQLGSYTVGPFQLLFLLSWAGRVTAVLWLLPVREPARPGSPTDS